MSKSWFAILLSAICLEGLGRKYLPDVPSVAFYFLKDVVLIWGYYRFPPPVAVRRTARVLYGSYSTAWVAGFAWTLIELFNPEHQSMLLGAIGFRAYWLWWMAPLVIAGFLHNEKERRQATWALVIMATGIAIFAAVQFASPPDSWVNLYSVVDGEEVYATTAVVASTGRARVSSTFSFLSGFSSFTILVPALLLSIGLEARDAKVRRAALTATLIAACTVPMSGSRTSVVMGGGVLMVTAWQSGLMFTRVGRRVMVGAVLAVILSVVAFPDAFLGVQNRFEDTEETSTRFVSAAEVLPPYALVTCDYPMLGQGTGMQQNARVSMGISAKYEAEGEYGRYLNELGPVGFLLIWTTKLGLMVALFRAAKILHRGGRHATAGAAVSYGGMSFLGNAAFDHIWQALYFLGVGFILSEVVQIQRNEESALAEATGSKPTAIPRSDAGPSTVSR